MLRVASNGISKKTWDVHAMGINMKTAQRPYGPDAVEYYDDVNGQNRNFSFFLTNPYPSNDGETAFYDYKSTDIMESHSLDTANFLNNLAEVTRKQDKQTMYNTNSGTTTSVPLAHPLGYNNAFAVTQKDMRIDSGFMLLLGLGVVYFVVQSL